jgi:hypothetical protein
MAKNAKIDRSQKLFLAAMKKKWAEDPSKDTWTKTEKELKDLGHATLIPFKDPCDVCTNWGAQCPNDPLCKLYDYKQFVQENEKTGEIYERSF